MLASPVAMPHTRPLSAPVRANQVLRNYAPPPKVLASRGLGYAIVARPLKWMPPSPGPRKPSRAATERALRESYGSPPRTSLSPPRETVPVREPHNLLWVHRDDMRYIFTLGDRAPKELQYLFRAAKLLSVPATTPDVQLSWQALMDAHAHLGGAHGLLESWRVLEDQVRHGTCTAKAAQRCVRFLKQHGCTPPDLNGHGFCFAKPLCTWLWYLCRLTLNSDKLHPCTHGAPAPSDKLHPKMKKWVREEASQELAWCSEYGDRASFMNDVKQAWEQRETLLETDLSRVK